jgi:hypothetical protein
MKRFLVVIILGGCFVLLGYIAMFSSPLPAMSKATVTPLIPGPMPTPRVPPNKTYYTKRCWPACHYDPNWISDEPPRNTLDFESTLGPGWAWINEDPSHWTLTEVPGALRIVSQSGSIAGASGLQGAKNVLVRDAPAAEFFDAITRVEFDPTSSFQEAAIFIQLDDGSLASLSRGYCREEDDASCVGSGVYFDGSGLGCARIGVPVSEGTVNLMLRQAGHSYVGYYCLGENIEPEAAWIEVGRCYSRGASPARVGLAVAHGEGADVSEIPADFDLFSTIERK